MIMNCSTIIIKDGDNLVLSIHSNSIMIDDDEVKNISNSEKFSNIFSFPDSDVKYQIELYELKNVEKYQKEDFLSVELDASNEDNIFINKLSLFEKHTYHIRTEGDVYEFAIGHQHLAGGQSLLPIRYHTHEKILAPGHQVGNIALKLINIQTDKVVTINFNVFPIKISVDELKIIYKETYDYHYKLLYSSNNTITAPLTNGKDIKKDAYQQLLLLEKFFSKKPLSLDKAIYSISQKPDRKLLQESNLVQIDNVENPDFDKISELIELGLVIKTSRRIPFSSFYNLHPLTVYDTPANRFVKYVINYFDSEIIRIKRKFKLESKENSLREQHFMNRCNKLRKKLLPLKNASFFESIKPFKNFQLGNNQVLLKDPSYKVISTAYIRYISKLFWPEDIYKKIVDIFQYPLKYIYEIYEYWCLFKIDETLRQVFELGDTTKIQLQFTEDNKPNGLAANYDKNIKLWYDISSSKSGTYHSWSVALRPDFVLQINDVMVVFDAKYRVDLDKELLIQNDNEDEIKSQEKRGNYVLQDLYKMHTYRDALRSDTDNKIVWVIALYPGTKSKLYYAKKSINKDVSFNHNLREFLYQIKNNPDFGEGVGAIPLRP